MKTPDSIVLSLQENLYLTCLAGYSADLFVGLSCPEGKEEQQIRWQQAVNEIGRCMLCGLLEIGSDGWMDAVGIQDVDSYLRALAENSPYDEREYDSPEVRYWMDPLLCGTQLCREIFSKYFDNEDALELPCKQFAEELDVLFDMHGVEWSADPFIPVGKLA